MLIIMMDINGQIRKRLDGFTMGAVIRLPSRSFYDPVKMLSSEEEMNAERTKVTNAMSAYIGKQVTGVNEEGNDIIKDVPVNKEPISRTIKQKMILDLG